MFQKLGVVGCGDCVKNRWWPAINNASIDVKDVLICSLEPSCTLKGRPYTYKGNTFSHWDIPSDYLNNTLWIVATPPRYHLHYVKGLRNCKVMVEKPLDLSLDEIDVIKGDKNVIPVDHKLMNDSIQCLFQKVDLLSNVNKVNITFYDQAGIINGRWQVDSLFDIQWHCLSLILALFKKVSQNAIIDINKCVVSYYTGVTPPKYQSVDVGTASLLKGRISDGALREWEFTFRQCIGASYTDKTVILYGPGFGEYVRWDETGYKSHEKYLIEMFKPEPQLPQSLGDAVEVLTVLVSAKGEMERELPYHFGTLPKFLLDK